MNGIVINLHALGATVRLDDGRLAAVPLLEASRFRSQLSVSLQRKRPIAFALEKRGRHLLAFPGENCGQPAQAAPGANGVATAIRVDQAAGGTGPSEGKRSEGSAAPGQDGLRCGGFEAMMNAYLKAVEEREPSNLPPPAERHFIRKKRRASSFEGREKRIISP